MAWGSLVDSSLFFALQNFHAEFEYVWFPHNSQPVVWKSSDRRLVGQQLLTLCHRFQREMFWICWEVKDIGIPSVLLLPLMDQYEMLDAPPPL